MLVLDTVTTVCVGMLAGVEFAVSAFVNPIVWKLDARAQADAIRMFAAKLGRVMPFWYAGSLLLLLAETVVRWHEAGSTLRVVAAATWAAVILLTVLFLVPINNRMAAMKSEALEGEEKRAHSKWDRMHQVRIVAVVAALVCFLVSILGA